MAVRVNKRREIEPRNVTIYTPHGTEITVTPERAKHLLERPALTFGDGTFRQYSEKVEDTKVADAPVTSKATPPRKAGE